MLSFLKKESKIYPIISIFFLITIILSTIFSSLALADNDPDFDTRSGTTGVLNFTPSSYAIKVDCGKHAFMNNVQDECKMGGVSWFIIKQKEDKLNRGKYIPAKYNEMILPKGGGHKANTLEANQCENFPFIIILLHRSFSNTLYSFTVANNNTKNYYNSNEQWDGRFEYNNYNTDYPGVYEYSKDSDLSGESAYKRLNDIMEHENTLDNNGEKEMPGVNMVGKPLRYELVRSAFRYIQKNAESRKGKNLGIIKNPFTEKDENGTRKIKNMNYFCYDPNEFSNESLIRTRTIAKVSVLNDSDGKKLILGKDKSGRDKNTESSYSPLDGVSEINNISIAPGQTAQINFSHRAYLQRSKNENNRILPWLVKNNSSSLKIESHQSLVKSDLNRIKSFNKKTGVSKNLNNSKESDWSVTSDQLNYRQDIGVEVSEVEKNDFKGNDISVNGNNLTIKVSYDKIRGEKAVFCKQIMTNLKTIGVSIEGNSYKLNESRPNPEGSGRDKKYNFSSVCVTITKKGGDPMAFHTRTRPIISSDKPGSIYEGDHFTGWSNLDAGKNVKVKITDNEKITIKFRYLAYSPYSGDLLEKAKAQGKIEEIKYLTNINRVPTSNNGSKSFTPLNPKTGNKNIDWYSSTIALKSHKNLFKTTYNYDTLYSRRIPGKGGGELSGANDFESKAEEVIGNKMSPGQEIKICGYAALNIRSLSFLSDTVKSSDKGEGIKFDKRVDNFSNGNAYYSYACVAIVKQGPLPPETMCQNIADTTQDQGNTGVASLVRNISRGQDYWPSINGINRTNPASSVRASIAGGKSGATNSTGFIYARPFDNIQFKHYLCYGFHAVESSTPGNPGRNKLLRRAIEYDISSTVNNASAPYLFGETFRDGNSDRVRIDGVGDLDKKESTIDRKSVIDDNYGISIESPTTLNARYNQCEEPEGYGLGPSADGYALPGKNHYCGSASQEVNSKKVGKTIYQHVNFPNNQAWNGRIRGTLGREKSNASNWVKRNSCGCDVNTSTFNDDKIPDYYGEKTHTSYYYEKNSCKWFSDQTCCTKYSSWYPCYKCTSWSPVTKENPNPICIDGYLDSCRDCLKYEHVVYDYYGGSSLDQRISVEYYPDNERYAGTHGRHNRPEDFNENFKESDDPIKYMRSKKDHNTHIGVKIPYNFRVTYDEKINLPGREADIVYAGEILQSPEVKATVHARPNPDAADQEYATITPRIKTRLLTFTVAPKVEYDSIKNLLTGSVQKYNIDGDKLCRSSFTFANRDECKTHDTDRLNNDRYLNPEGKYKGEEERINTPTISVPDVEIGTKFCVAHAIWPADSHGLPYDNQKEVPRNREDLQNRALGNGIESGSTGYWRISEPVCRTIAKKPTTHVHGGSIEAKGTESSTTSKIIGVGFEQNLDSKRLTYFGSFTDQNIISNDKVIGTGSGASFGYYLNDSPKENNEKLSLPGGNKKDPSVNEYFCKHYSILTISKDCSGFHFGDANIDRNTEIINNLYNRYTGHKSSKSEILSIDSIEPCPNNSAIGDCLKSNDTRYILADNNATISKPNSYNNKNQIELKYKESKNNEYINNTYVIDASGKTININSDICVGDCSDNITYNGSEEVPQLLIFADNINISGKVKRIDAWLIADKNINTCTEFDDSTIQSAISFSNRDGQKCTNQLVINGPVFSKNGRIDLNRTAGTYSGNPQHNTLRILNWPSKPSFNLNNDGPITPAEIINLRADAYIWAFAQAQRLTQAQVVYRRELPVRY